ncbi:nucleotidyltransferase substrate binding protein [Synechococcus sp. MIT S9510]|uniref:nucleotidyltransferase substrate binding protein n=1 Tax=unclassified Synechococcus TaxID=2626047 RepID=UPI0039B0A29C
MKQQGLIQAFEFTNKLSWLLLKDFLVDQGVRGISDSRDAVREVVAKDLLPAGKERNWMAMIPSRNLKSHTNSPGFADEISNLISTKTNMNSRVCSRNCAAGPIKADYPLHSAMPIAKSSSS